MPKAFISSTSKDLIEHRAAVKEACLNAGFEPVGMENFVARSEDAVTVCYKEIEEADLFIGIYAWRYGYIPPDADCSITELEYRKAGEISRPRYCFLVDENYPWPQEFRETGVKARLLQLFKDNIELSSVRATFTTPEDLAAKVAATLARHARLPPQDKPVAEHTIRNHLSQQALLTRLQKEVDELEINLAEVRRKRQPGSRVSLYINAYILLGFTLLCILGTAISQSPVLGILVLVGGLGLSVKYFDAKSQKHIEFDHQIIEFERQIRDRQRQIRQVQIELERENISPAVETR